VLAASEAPYREFRVDSKKERVGPPAVPSRNANAYDTAALAQNAKYKMPIILNKYCSFSAHYTPTAHITTIFPCTPKKTTLGEFRAAVQTAIRLEGQDRELLAAAFPMCTMKPAAVEGVKTGSCFMDEQKTIEQEFGEGVYDLYFPTPQKFIRVVAGPADSFDVAVCAMMTSDDLRVLIRRRLGLKEGVPVEFEWTEWKGVAVPEEGISVHHLMFAAGKAPVYTLRLGEFKPTDYNSGGKVIIVPEAVSSVGKLIAGKAGRLLNRNVLIVIALVLVGVALIAFGIMSSSDEDEAGEGDLGNAMMMGGGGDGLPTVCEQTVYDGLEQKGVDEVNVAAVVGEIVPVVPSENVQDGFDYTDQSNDDAIDNQDQDSLVSGSQAFETGQVQVSPPNQHQPYSQPFGQASEVNTDSPPSFNLSQ
jgi:hypothetical protein